MQKIYRINEGLQKRFPAGTDPFQIMTWLAEEVVDVLRCALQIAMYYGVEAELETAVAESYARMVKEGLISE